MSFDVTSDIDISKYDLGKNINRLINFSRVIGLNESNKFREYF